MLVCCCCSRTFSFLLPDNCTCSGKKKEQGVELRDLGSFVHFDFNLSQHYPMQCQLSDDSLCLVIFFFFLIFQSGANSNNPSIWITLWGKLFDVHFLFPMFSASVRPMRDSNFDKVSRTIIWFGRRGTPVKGVPIAPKFLTIWVIGIFGGRIFWSL